MSATVAGRRLTVAVMRDRYPSLFCTPRVSRHAIRPSTFLPTHRIYRKCEGITVIDSRGADLIHVLNRIPLGTRKPFVITFESHLPRYFGGELTRLYAYERQRLTAPSCKAIVAYSEWARHIFLETHRGTEDYATLAQKLRVIYPNITLSSWNASPTPAAEPLRLVFVGAHFGRKGGAVAARAAEIARGRGLRLHVHIISSLEVGGGIWSDPKRPGFFEPYLCMLEASNVTYYSRLPNQRVREIMESADFSILATLSDTFGYSAVESLAAGTPVIATAQGALPEFVKHGENGVLLQLDTDSFGEWVHVSRPDKDSRRFESLYWSEIERLAADLVEAVAPYAEDRQALVPLRAASRQTAERLFNTETISPALDRLYDEAAS